MKVEDFSGCGLVVEVITGSEDNMRLGVLRMKANIYALKYRNI